MFLIRRTFGLSSDDSSSTVVPALEPSTTAPSVAAITSPTSTSNDTSNSDAVKAPEEQPVAGSVGATLWSLLSSKLGGDVLQAGISLPSWLYEPLSILQRQAEMVEYGQVLSKAASCEDVVERLAYTAGFAVSGYSATQRYKPDFNPLLGETYEYIDRRCNTKFFAEQVSHHPPISALHAINENNWIFYQNSSPTTKFLGNCMDLDTKGKSHVQFPKYGDHYFYTNPQCTRIHNIIFGSMWIEHFGALSIKNVDGSLSTTITFKKSGLFQGTQYKVEGYIEDKNGKRLVKLEGRWDDCLEGKWLEDTAGVKKGEVRKLWSIDHASFLHDEYNWTTYTRSLNDYDKEMQKILLPTDSRRRPDRIQLCLGASDEATKWKKAMEERQRQDRKSRTDSWQPLWFKKDETSIGDMWVYNGGYWEERDKKVENIRKGRDSSTNPRSAVLQGLACDYTSYPTAADEQDTTTDTTTLTTTDSDPKEDDTDTETELEGWSASDTHKSSSSPTADTTTTTCAAANSIVVSVQSPAAGEEVTSTIVV